ncbi:hypothetical protein [Nitrospira sp. Nam80]
MRSLLLIFCLTGILSGITTAPSDAADSEKTESNKGLTIEDIGQGLKSAAKNIGDEIPKIGPAIGDTFRNITDRDKEQDKASKKPAANNSVKDKK